MLMAEKTFKIIKYTISQHPIPLFQPQFIHSCKTGAPWLSQGHTSGLLFAFPQISWTYIQELKGFRLWNSGKQPKVLHNFCSGQEPSGTPCHESTLLPSPPSSAWACLALRSRPHTAFSLFHVFLALRVVWLQSWARISIIYITSWSPARNPSGAGCFSDYFWEVRIPLPECSVLFPITFRYKIVHHSPLPHIQQKNSSIFLQLISLSGQYYSDMGHWFDHQKRRQ